MRTHRAEPLSRRTFVKYGALTLVGFVGSGTIPAMLVRAAAASGASPRRRVLVVVFQRGAADGLNVVVPHFEEAYYRLRPTIAIAPPKAGAREACVDLDGRFGLHPALASLHRWWQDKHLAVVHAAGSPDDTRSHFDAQDAMESGTPGIKSTRDGWMNRYLGAHDREHARALRAIAMSSEMPRTLAGPAPALNVASLDRFGIDVGRPTPLVRGGLDALYRDLAGDALAEAAREGFAAEDTVRRVAREAGEPRNGARYPNGPYGWALRDLARLIRADVGVETGFVDSGGWDDHVAEGGATGPMANRLRALAQGLDAFARDLGDRLADVVVVTMSEFGRTVAENGTRGTDHGHGNCMLVLGGDVAGGRVLGRWPGLAPEQRFEGRDLAVTTDYRDVVGEVLARHLAAEDGEAVFPGYGIDATRFVGLFAPTTA